MIDLTNSAPDDSKPANKPLIELADAKQYLASVTERVMSFAGKPGYNSYLFAEQSGLNKLNGQVGALTDNSNQDLLRQAMEFQYKEPSLNNLKTLFVAVKYA